MDPKPETSFWDKLKAQFSAQAATNDQPQGAEPTTWAQHAGTGIVRRMDPEKMKGFVKGFNGGNR